MWISVTIVFTSCNNAVSGSTIHAHQQEQPAIRIFYLTLLANCKFSFNTPWHFSFPFSSHRFNIKGRIYPAILPVESKKVAGMVCLTVAHGSTCKHRPCTTLFAYLRLLALQVVMGVTDEELQVLDAFEDVEYTRTRVEISLTVRRFGK
jgi:hypothetical protein